VVAIGKYYIGKFRLLISVERRIVSSHVEKKRAGAILGMKIAKCIALVKPCYENILWGVPNGTLK